MADSVNVMDAILDKKMDSYEYDVKRNIKAPEEIMVTITLNEYRDLVSKVAPRESAIAKAEEDKYSRNSENEKLKKEVQELKEKLYDLQEKYCKPCEEGNEDGGDR